MTDSTDYLALDDRALLSQCQVNTHRSSGPGGQHRNKVSSAVRLRHGPTGISASAADSRSQHENKRLALARLRMAIACGIRRPVDSKDLALPTIVADCIFTPKTPFKPGLLRLQIGRKDQQFWPVAAFLLDLLVACNGRLGQAADLMGITTSNLAAVLKSDRHLLAATQDIRKHNNLKSLT